MNMWDEDYTVRFYQINNRKYACPSLVCDFLQDAAVNHIEALGHSLEKLHLHRHGWVLSKMKLQMNRPPKWKERISVKTWQPGIDTIYALRDYLLTTEDGEEIAKATSYWLALDLDNNRILKPQGYLKKSVFIEGYRAIPEKLKKIRTVHRKPKKTKFTVDEENLDLNGHMNSMAYIKWICRSLDKSIINTHEPLNLEINYHNQSFLGDKIVLHSDYIERNSPSIFETYHTFYKEGSDTLLCTAKLTAKDEGKRNKDFEDKSERAS